MPLECTSLLCVWFVFLKKKHTHKNPKKNPPQNKTKEKITLQVQKERKKWSPAGLKFSDDKAEGNRLIPSMKAAQKDKMQRGEKNLFGLPALAWNGCFPSYCQLPCFMLTLHILCCRSTPMLMLAQQNYLSCVTAVVTELLALQIPEHHFNA